jgi:hypothetical protein
MAQSRVPAGAPTSTGGQFSENARQDAEITLGEDSSTRWTRKRVLEAVEAGAVESVPPRRLLAVAQAETKAAQEAAAQAERRKTAAREMQTRAENALLAEKYKSIKTDLERELAAATKIYASEALTLPYIKKRAAEQSLAPTGIRAAEMQAQSLRVAADLLERSTTDETRGESGPLVREGRDLARRLYEKADRVTWATNFLHAAHRMPHCATDMQRAAERVMRDGFSDGQGFPCESCGGGRGHYDDQSYSCNYCR